MAYTASDLRAACATVFETLPECVYGQDLQTLVRHAVMHSFVYERQIDPDAYELLREAAGDLYVLGHLNLE